MPTWTDQGIVAFFSGTRSKRAGTGTVFRMIASVSKPNHTTAMVVPTIYCSDSLHILNPTLESVGGAPKQNAINLLGRNLDCRPTLVPPQVPF